MSISEILKKLRKESGETQADIAKLFGYSTTAYQCYEYGTSEPSLENLCILADHFNVSVDYLLERDKKKNSLGCFEIPADQRSAMERYLELDEKHRRIVIDSLIAMAESAVEARKQTEPSQQESDEAQDENPEI